MAIYRRCNTCHTLFSGSGCPECAKRWNRISANKRQARDEGLKMYSQSVWQKCRAAVRAKYHDFDIWLLGAGIWRVPDKVYVHHIIERDEDPDLRYRIDNLITVSHESHEEIHRMYETDKAAALKRIRQGIENFEAVYGE